ncbi:halocyanin [Haloarcula hispanica N601]|uniref:Halocyanin domain-containing protein n=3 Tax=Haloarcula hispanica TaxID=51589 RepID=A0A482TEH5_HALHI|nr:MULTISPECIES: halocyanin domain-containing protein [Haloarcula]AEM56192.1 halocyanin precursor-like protein [Haloarcula hispanica ATCC 33960]AHB65004.1 halocyanin [Haloarcula hispanica N601]KAA9408026.1 halocyanin domain-containing protein [Haloarcula sp. CBA1131]KAA9408926.1 halocyanin domain-containing protein [Haloarcula hispanica]MCJ0620959.1 halocyanin domain-containing protein [Haloarcula hispanica]
MTDGRADVSRRGFLRTAAGATAASAAAGTATAQEGTEGGDGGGGGGEPDYGGFLDQVGNFDGSTVDATGQDTATVEVGVQANGGAFGFGPPAIHVDNGATVQFEWTGNGGGHNVVSDGDGPLDSGSAVSSAGVNYEHTFEEDGIYPYVCVPHESLGMKGAVVVGTDYPAKSSGGGGGSGSSGPPEVPNSAKTLGVATSFVMVATLGLAYFFIRYGGDYETPE